jgi:predicted O-methyltransferase YrrM
MEITAGNITAGEAERLHRASRLPRAGWEGGDTEPWILEAVTGLLLASGQRIVLELGGYHGAGSVALAQTLDRLGCPYRHLIVVEYDAALATIVHQTLTDSGTTTPYTIQCRDSLEAIAALDDRSIGFAWVDDSHDTPHVMAEMERLIPKMVDDGIICFHDVCGTYRLHQVVSMYGGISLNLPRVSSSGGLGILQVRPSTRTRPIPTYKWEEIDDPNGIKVIGSNDEPL